MPENPSIGHTPQPAIFTGQEARSVQSVPTARKRNFSLGTGRLLFHVWAAGALWRENGTNGDQYRSAVTLAAKLPMPRERDYVEQPLRALAQFAPKASRQNDLIAATARKHVNRALIGRGLMQRLQVPGLRLESERNVLASYATSTNPKRSPAVETN
jgi:hypothetical protein